MKNKCKGIDILDLKIDKSLKYMAMAFSGAFMHLTFLALFMMIRLYTMAVFNIFSVTLYLIIGATCKQENFEKTAYNWIRAMYTEICVHALLCTIMLGAGSCFFLYTLMTIPVVLYYLFFTCGDNSFKRGMLRFSLCSLAFIAFELIIDHYFTPLYSIYRGELTGSMTDLIRAINVFFNILMIFGFSTLFILEIHNLIMDLNSTNEQLHYTATHDALTGLYNRHSLNGTLTALKTDNRPFCIVMGDLDDFKKINDTYGHECGDNVLKSVAEIILRSVGSENTACRWGGEEIMIIMYGSSIDCLHTITRIKTQISELNITCEGKPVNVSMTFGFAASSESGSPDIDAMLSTVDKRLYKGKASGKNIIIVE